MRSRARNDNRTGSGGRRRTAAAKGPGGRPVSQGPAKADPAPDGLGALLEGLHARHHHLENLNPDPLVFPRQYAEVADGELAGLVAAGLAYGQVDQIMLTLGQVFGTLGPSPAGFLRATPPRQFLERFAGFSYRFHKAGDLALLLHLVGQVLDRYGSLLKCFLDGDRGGAIGPALGAFADRLLSGDARPILASPHVPPGHPVRHFLPSPARGGAAKRLCLYLRWMVRKDDLDPGFWHGVVDPARLVVPLDTHVARVGRELGLSTRRTADWKTACEITDALRRHDPRDPVRYDFSLFRYGMGRGQRSRGK